MKAYGISAITLFVKNMDISCKFYSIIPGFRLVCGGTSDSFTTYEIGEGSKMYLNLELKNEDNKKDFGRIIFHTSNVDELYAYLKKDYNISKLGSFENEPTNASWGERFFHMRDPDGYQLSFAMPIKKKVQPTKSPNDFARQHRTGMRNRRKLGKHSRHYEQG